MFFPVNCTSKLQPLDLRIIQNFKVHYRKLLHVITMATEHDSATDIAKTLDVLQAINWIGNAWSKVENNTIIKCFAAAGISSTLSEDLEISVDEELEDLVQRVAPGNEMSTYLGSDEELQTCYSLLNEEQLQLAISTSHQVTEIESDDDRVKQKMYMPRIKVQTK